MTAAAVATTAKTQNRILVISGFNCRIVAVYSSITIVLCCLHQAGLNSLAVADGHRRTEMIRPVVDAYYDDAGKRRYFKHRSTTQIGEPYGEKRYQERKVGSEAE